MVIRKGIDVFERCDPIGLSSVVILIPAFISSQEKVTERGSRLTCVQLHLVKSGLR